MNTAKKQLINADLQQPTHDRLSRCCASKTKVTLVAPSSGNVCEGFFYSLDDDSVRIRLYPGDCPLSSDHVCCCSFEHENQRCFLLATIQRIQETLDREVVIAIPEQIVAEKRQNAARIPVAQEAGFRAELLHGERRIPGYVQNVNMNGALVEFNELLDIKLETQVGLKLTLGHHNAQVPACPVRREATRLGFAFEGQNTNDWKQELKQLLSHLEREQKSGPQHTEKIRRPFIGFSLGRQSISSNHSV